ncbi:unnamed protein product [Amoebophrya sp. A25]|nr:unnamed protein product [Amoebophrya sp. A25]|eukprot:GSA25T00010109001.1
MSSKPAKGKGKGGKKGGGPRRPLQPDQEDPKAKFIMPQGNQELTREAREAMASSGEAFQDQDAGEGVNERGEVEQKMIRTGAGLWQRKYAPKNTVTSSGESLLVSAIRDDVAQLNWTCAACGTVNVRVRKHCVKCRQAYTGLKDLLTVDEKLHGHENNFIDGAHLRYGPEAASSSSSSTANQPRGRPTGWQCGSCDFVNKLNRATCQRCFENKHMGELVYEELWQYNRGAGGSNKSNLDLEKNEEKDRIAKLKSANAKEDFRGKMTDKERKEFKRNLRDEHRARLKGEDGGRRSRSRDRERTKTRDSGGGACSTRLPFAPPKQEAAEEDNELAEGFF